MGGEQSDLTFSSCAIDYVKFEDLSSTPLRQHANDTYTTTPTLHTHNTQATCNTMASFVRTFKTLCRTPLVRQPSAGSPLTIELASFPVSSSTAVRPSMASRMSSLRPQLQARPQTVRTFSTTPARLASDKGKMELYSDESGSLGAGIDDVAKSDAAYDTSKGPEEAAEGVEKEVSRSVLVWLVSEGCFSIGADTESDYLIVLSSVSLFLLRSPPGLPPSSTPFYSPSTLHVLPHSPTTRPTRKNSPAKTLQSVHPPTKITLRTTRTNRWVLLNRALRILTPSRIVAQDYIPSVGSFRYDLDRWEQRDGSGDG